MLESGSSGSVRGVPSNGHPYRDPRPIAALTPTKMLTGLHPALHVGARRSYHGEFPKDPSSAPDRIPRSPPSPTQRCCSCRHNRPDANGR
jgi:hypothetical protein